MMDDIEKDKKEVKKNQDIRIYGFIGNVIMNAKMGIMKTSHTKRITPKPISRGSGIIMQFTKICGMENNKAKANAEAR